MASAMYSTGDRVIGIHIGIGIYNGNDTGSCSDSGSGSVTGGDMYSCIL